MDPFDEFARAIAADNPEKYTIPEAPNNLKCEICSLEFSSHDHLERHTEKVHPKSSKSQSKKKSKKEERKEYENDYLRRLELTTEQIKKARAEIESTDEKVEVNRTKPRKVSDIHKLTREEVEKARAEIEIIKIREPHRQSQKTIPTQATILNAGTELDDCYVIFGIDQHITCDELKKQFRELSVKYNSSIGRLQKTKEENEIMEKVHTRINQAYTQLYETHKCGDR